MHEIAKILRSVSSTGVFGLLSRHSRESHRALKMIFDLGAILMQATGFIIWPLVESWQVGSQLSCFAIFH